jgi:hypothetical protein
LKYLQHPGLLIVIHYPCSCAPLTLRMCTVIPPTSTIHSTLDVWKTYWCVSVCHVTCRESMSQAASAQPHKLGTRPQTREVSPFLIRLPPCKGLCDSVQMFLALDANRTPALRIHIMLAPSLREGMGLKSRCAFQIACTVPLNNL